MNEPVGPLTLLLLVIPAAALRIAVRALYGRQRLAAADPMQMLLSMSSTILFILAGLGLIAGLMGLWVLMIPLPIVFVGLALMTIDRLRHSEHRALVWALSAAAQKGVPLSEAARAYADETMGDTGMRALALAHAVERGEPLPVAVRTARLRMSTAMNLAVRLGERLGMLGAAMRDNLGGARQVDAALQTAVGRFFYLCGVASALACVAGFMVIFMMPKFERSIQSFGVDLSPTTLLVFSASHWLRAFGWLLAPLFLLLVVPFFLIAALYYLGWLPRNIPLLWRLFKRFDGALVMRGLALAVRKGWPLPQALHLVADCYPLSIVAGLVRRAATRVEGGQDWCDSLRQTGLIGRADAAVLSAAARAGNLDWALEEMADSALRRQAYWIGALVQILFPALLLVLATLVFVVAAGMFLPLVAVIERMIN
jgi:type II secretory pathway component PulF